MTIGGTPHDMHVGDVLIIPWAESVAYSADRKTGLTIASIHLVLRMEEKKNSKIVYQIESGHVRARLSPEGLPVIPVKKTSTECLPNLLDVALGIVDTWSLESTHSDWRTYRLEGLTACLVTALDHPPNHDHPMQALLWWIRQNYHRNITRGEMCHRAGLGSTALGHAMRQATGLSPTAYVISLRLNHARQLLTNTRMTVHEVANAVGIRNRTHFFKLYHDHFGHAPRERPHEEAPDPAAS